MTNNAPSENLPIIHDGIIDPRDTRRVLGMALSVCAEGDARVLRPMQFGVARM